MSLNKKHRYHHGNLKQDLLTAAMRALESEGWEKLSLRRLAKTLGVTPTAVYGHFSDKVDLLIELRTLGFAQLSEAMNGTIEHLPAESNGEDKVRALSKTYMQFAVSHPHLFDILFAWTPDFTRITAERAAESCSGEGILRRAITELMQDQGATLNDYQSAVASFSAWSLVHGISILLKSGSVEGVVYCEHWPPSFSASQPESQAKIIDHLLTVQIEGLKAAAAKYQYQQP